MCTPAMPSGPDMEPTSRMTLELPVVQIYRSRFMSDKPKITLEVVNKQRSVSCVFGQTLCVSVCAFPMCSMARLRIIS